MVRFFEQEANQMLPDVAMSRKAEDPALAAFFEAHPEWKRPAAQWRQAPADPQQERERQMQTALRARLHERGCNHSGGCDYLHGMKHQMAVSKAVMAGQPEEVIDRFLYEVIREVVMHEVGHTLGLRHNFKASSVYSVEEIQKRRAGGEATCGSVMDYNPVLFFAQNATGGNFITPTIGPYDYWAIEYGYRPFDATYKSHQQGQQSTEEPQEKPAETNVVPEEKVAEQPAGKPAFDLSQIPADVLAQMPDEVKAMLTSGSAAIATGGEPAKKTAPAPAAPIAGEDAMLADIASRSTEPQLAYATDEDSTFLSPDPTVNRFDMGGDPIEWAEARMAVVDQRMNHILDWAVKDGESWYHLRSAYQTLMFEKLQLLDYVGRYIGGQYFDRAHRGQQDKPPFVLVEPARQRRALAFIADNLFQDDFFSTSPELLNHLAPSRWSHTGSSVSYALDYPIRNLIGLMQWWNLLDRVHPATLRRIHDAELKTDAADRFTLAEYIRALKQGCWAEAVDGQRLSAGSWSDAQPFVSDIRRSLQREYLTLMEQLVRYAPGMLNSPDIHALLRASLRELADEIAKVKDAEELDFASRAHFDACHARIERVLSPELPEYDY